MIADIHHKWLRLAALLAAFVLALSGCSTGTTKPTKDTPRRYLVEFKNEANLSHAYQISDWVQRGQYVVDQLKKTAHDSQSQALAFAKREGIKANSYWISNAMVFTSKKQFSDEIAGFAGVTQVIQEPALPHVTPDQDFIPASKDEISSPPWNIQAIHADQVWAQGITGKGVVFGNIDTGVQYNHPQLVTKYRGNLGTGQFDHNYNWFDPSGKCPDAPCDVNEHGTHVMGLMVGGDGPGPDPVDIGVAPGATWIAARGCIGDTCPLSDILGAAQFMLAPTNLQGAHPDPAKRPHIVNNSYELDEKIKSSPRALRAGSAAGMVATFAVGNAGSNCGTAGYPSEIAKAISVGTTDDQNHIDPKSSRGPGTTKDIVPHVVAPGFDVISTVGQDGYAHGWGSSMATPHVSGVLALMMEADRNVITSVRANAIITGTANRIDDKTCGADPSGTPNNVYGFGLVDALAAVNKVQGK